MCVRKRLGVHTPLSTQMAFASDAVFSFNLQFFIAHITYCKPSTHTNTNTHSLLVQPNTVASCSGMTFSSLTLPSGTKLWQCLNGGMLSKHRHSITTSSPLSLFISKGQTYNWSWLLLFHSKSDMVQSQSSISEMMRSKLWAIISTNKNTLPVWNISTTLD